MEIYIRKFEKNDVTEMVKIWNEVVEDGIAFPQEELLDEKSGEEFFSAQTYCAVAYNGENGELLGLYILHPNNVGRCGHISNASFAVKSAARNLGIGRKLVTDCMNEAGKNGFKILQFNAVVRTNNQARYLYEELGFKALGVISGGLRMKDGSYEDIVPYYHEV